MSMVSLRFLSMGFLAIGLCACVPKTEFEDQQSELQEAKAQIRTLSKAQSECDPDTFLELKEQTQSLDVLQQELIDRNTELAEEVARLRQYEAQVKGGDLDCERRVDAMRKDYEGQLKRTKATYEDLIRELKVQIKERDAEIAAYRRQLSERQSPKKSGSSAPSKSKSEPKSKAQ